MTSKKDTTRDFKKLINLMGSHQVYVIHRNYIMMFSVTKVLAKIEVPLTDQRKNKTLFHLGGVLWITWYYSLLEMINSMRY